MYHITKCIEINYKVPSNKTLVWRLGLELVSIAVVGIMVLVPYLFRGYWFAKPQVRGFFCNDENIKHPFIAETIRYLDINNFFLVRMIKKSISNDR